MKEYEEQSYLVWSKVINEKRFGKPGTHWLTLTNSINNAIGELRNKKSKVLESIKLKDGLRSLAHLKVFIARGSISTKKQDKP